MRKLNVTLRTLALASLCLMTSVGRAVGAEGDSETTARALTMSASGFQKNTATLVQDPQFSSSYVFYWKWTLAKNSAYTIRVADGIVGLPPQAALGEAATLFTDCGVFDGFRYYLNTSATDTTYFFHVMGQTAESVAVEYGSGVLLPEGSKYRPATLTVGAELASSEVPFLMDTRTKAAQTYYYRVQLEKGVSAYFQVTGGTVESPVGISITGDASLGTTLPEECVVRLVDCYGGRRLKVTPTASGTYLLQVQPVPEARVVLTRGKYKARTLGEHGASPIALGEAVTCEPGGMHAVAGYQDDIIDEQLFSVDLSGRAGKSFYVESTQSTTNLLAVVYDGAGEVLAQGRSQADGNLRFTFVAPEGAGICSIGVCQDLADEATETPSRNPIELTVRDVEDEGILRYDAADLGDGTAEGAFPIEVGLTETTLSRTLWGTAPLVPDAEDWFRFETEPGKGYHFRFAKCVGHLRLALYAADGKKLKEASDGFLAHSADQAGTVYVRVSRAAGFETEDASYSLAFKAVEAGMVSVISATCSADETDAFAVVRVVRNGGVGAARVRYGTVPGTAVADVDYLAQGGVVEWSALSGPTQEIRIALLPDWRPTVQGDRRFYVRLGQVEPTAYGESVPAVVEPSVATVVIHDTDVQDVPAPVQPEPSVDVNTVTDGGDDLQLAYGVFRGVLKVVDENAGVDPAQAVGLVEVSTTNGLQAIVRLAGESYAFKANAYRLEGDCVRATLKRSGTEDTLSVTLDNRKISTLKSALPENSGTAALSLTVSDQFGPLGSVAYLATLDRDNRAEGPFHRVSAAFAGQYTLALKPVAPGVGDPSGLGFATVKLAEAGLADIAGRLPDGTPFACSAVMAACAGEIVRLPVQADGDGWSVGGYLELSADANGLRVVGAAEELMWFVESGVRRLRPSGHAYDPTVSTEAVIARYALLADDDGAGVLPQGAWDQAVFEVSAETGSFEGLIPVVGAVDPADMAGVFLTPVEGGDSLLFAGSVDGGRAPLYVWGTQRVSPAEDWGFSVTVDFLSDGEATGLPPSITGTAGEIVALPTAVPERSGYEFVGWREESGALLKAGVATEFRLPAADGHLTAAWTRSTAGFAQALDCEQTFADTDFLSDGNQYNWYVHADASYVGGRALLTEPMLIRNNSCELETQVEGAGEVAFRWKFILNGRPKTGTGQDAIRFFIDGELVSALTRTEDWADVRVPISTVGSHTLTWRVSRLSDTLGGSIVCIGGLDKLSFQPYVSVVFDSAGGTACEPVILTAGSKFASLPVPTWGKRVFEGWYDASGRRYQVGDEVPDVPRLALKARWSYPEVTLSYAAGGASGTVPRSVTSRYPEKVAVAGPDTLTPPAGKIFAYWSGSDGETYRPGEMFAFQDVPVTLTAAWRPSPAGFATALDCSSFTADGAFSVDGAGAWTVVEDVTAVGGTALRSDALSTAGARVWTETTVEGEGVVSFSWKLLYDSGVRSGVDALILAVDGQEVATLQENSPKWRACRWPIAGEGTHVIRWTAAHGPAPASGTATIRGWLDNFRFDPAVRVTFDANGGTCERTEDVYGAGALFFDLPQPTFPGMEFYGWDDAQGNRYVDGSQVPAVDELALTAVWGNIRCELSYAAGEGSGVVPASVRGCYPEEVKVAEPTELVPPANMMFYRWQGSDGKIYDSGDTFAFLGEDVVLTALWTKSTVGFAAALECDEVLTDRDFAQDGSTTWSILDDATAEGQTALTSGFLLTKGSSTKLVATVMGAGDVSFKWRFVKNGKSVAGTGDDSISFWVDNVEQGRLTSTVGWTDMTCSLEGSGAHVLEWRVALNSTKSGSGNWNCGGFVDALNVAVGTPVTVTFDPDGGSCAETSREVLAFSKLKNLPEPTKELYEFAGWYDGETRYRDGDSVPEVATLNLKAKWVLRTCRLTYAAGGATGTVPAEQSGLVSNRVEVAEPDGLVAPAGRAFQTWRADDGTPYQPGDMYEFTGTDVVMTAVWVQSTAGFSAALDCAGILADTDFAAGGAVIWASVSDATARGQSALGCEALTTADDTAWTEVSVAGPTIVEFAWQLAYDGTPRSGVDTLTLSVDGQPAALLDAATAVWKAERLVISGEGAHTLRWTLVHGAGAASCRAMLDALAFRQPVTVTFDANGGTSATNELVFGVGETMSGLPTATYVGQEFDGWHDADGTAYADGDVVPEVPALALKAWWSPIKTELSYAAGGATGTVPASARGTSPSTVKVASPDDLVAPTGMMFVNWSGSDGRSYAPGDDFHFGSSDVVLTAVWSLSTKNFALALDCESAPFAFSVTNGQNWAEFTDTSATGESVLRSNFCTKNQAAWFEATIDCACSGEISFDWRAITETEGSLFDFLNVALDGVATNSTRSAVWSSVTLPVAKGRHTLRWTFTKRAKVTKTGDARASGFVDCLTWWPDAVTVTVNYGAGIESVLLGATPVASGTQLPVAEGSLDLTVKAVAWHAPDCADSIVTTMAATNDNQKVYTVTPTEDGTVTFTAKAYQGDASGKITVDGKTVDAAKAVAWGTAYSVVENAFAASYDDYLLNEAPGAGGGLVIQGITRTAAGGLEIVVGRTKDCFALNAINGTLVLLGTASLSDDFTALSSEAVTVKPGEESATLSLAAPTGASGFYKVEVR